MFRRLTDTLHFKGKGLHTGEPSEITVRPAESGYVFVKDGVRIPALYENVCDTVRNTTLCSGDARVMTVEHLLSALYGLRVVGAEIEVSGPEIPVLDGSALEFAEALYETSEETEGKAYALKMPLSLKEGAEIRGFPSETLRVSYALEYGAPVRYSAFIDLEVTPETYLKEIAPARTFAFEEEVKELLSEGLARGGSLDNALILTGEGPRNERIPDEAVRHKVLDFLGDLALCGRFIDGHYVVFRGGHSSHTAFARRLAEEGIWGDSMDVKDILSLLPHRYPFLLVDRIIHMDERRIVGIKNVTFNEDFFNGHFPDDPIMPGVLQIEALAQVAGVGLAHKLREMGKGDVLPLFAGIENVRFRRVVRPGDTLVLEATLLRFGGRLAKARGRAFVDGDLTAEAVMIATFVPREGT